MSKKPNPIPEGQGGAVPYLCARDAAQALAFYAKAFGATETMRMAEPSGRIGHAEFRIGRATFMLSDEYPDHGALSPQTLKGSPVAMHLYVEDVDALARRAVDAGATLTRPIKDEFYGDRSAVLIDPFGHRWFLASRIEEVSAEEMQRRYDAMMKSA